MWHSLYGWKHRYIRQLAVWTSRRTRHSSAEIFIRQLQLLHRHITNLNFSTVTSLIHSHIIHQQVQSSVKGSEGRYNQVIAKITNVYCLSNALHSSIGQNIKSLACRCLVSGQSVKKTSNGHNSATCRPMFGSRLGFFARTDSFV